MSNDEETVPKSRYEILRRAFERVVAKNKELRRQLDFANQTAHRRNLELDALHYVWCTGACDNGLHRYHKKLPPLTEDIVKAAEKVVQRMRRWVDNSKFKKLYHGYQEEGFSNTESYFRAKHHMKRGTAPSITKRNFHGLCKCNGTIRYEKYPNDYGACEQCGQLYQYTGKSA